MTNKTFEDCMTTLEENAALKGNRHEQDKEPSKEPDEAQTWDLSPEFQEAMSVLAGTVSQNDESETADEV